MRGQSGEGMIISYVGKRLPLMRILDSFKGPLSRYMKSPVLFTLALVATASLSCEKEESVSADPVDLDKSCASPPQPVRFVLLDKQGTALVPSSTASLGISYATATGSTQLPYVVSTLQSPGTPNKYGGVGIGCDMGGYSVRAIQPVKEFTLTWNGQPVGVLTYDLQKVNWRQGCYKEAAFLFNGKPVVVDATVMPFVALLPTEMVQ